jgi:N-acetylglucosaminyldiphosphoundecaprenol N-acetyl-beta-D-mannosaminyltransferase
MIFNKLLTDPKDVLHKVLDSIERKESLLLTYLNQHCFNIYCKNNGFRKLLDTKFNVYQADLGVFLAVKFLYKREIQKIDATAMNQLILNELIKNKIPLSIVGSDFDTNFIQEETKKKEINLVCYKNGYFEESQTENIMRELVAIGGQVFIIGMGVPKQELFAEKLSQMAANKVIICVGNYFEFYFGTKKRVPVFIQNICMEWMFRLITEPGRLWKRYLVGIPVFIFRILKIKFQRKSN